MTACTLCGRHLLVGERYRRWAAPETDGDGRAVCSLCEPEAARAGWARVLERFERQGVAGPVSTVRLVA